MAALTHIERTPFGAPTPEEIAHTEIARQHFLKYCDSGKCIRGAAHARKANWHEGFCLECAFNPYNMAAQREKETYGWPTSLDVYNWWMEYDVLPGQMDIWEEEQYAH